LAKKKRDKETETKRIHITLDTDYIDFMDSEIKENRFWSYSHAITVALKELKDKIRKKKED